MITADDLRARMAGLEPIGLAGGATTRLAWTPEDAATGEWFGAQADGAGLRVERDGAGNRWAVPDGPGPWWGVGSHLDSVRGGGRFDGALGVVAAFAVAALADAPVAVVSFADEEGARFNTPTFGSRALAGMLDVEEVLARVDDGGVSLADAMGSAGVDPDGLGTTAEDRFARLRGFLELHIDQSRDVATAGVPFGVATGLAARTRLRVELTGGSDHAGTTSMDDRRDALAAAARIAVAALDLAGPDMRVTPGRILAEPNAPTTIARHARLWLDARAPDPATLDEWVVATERAAGEIAERGRVGIELRVESRSDGIAFDPDLRMRLGAPEILCFAGHDAGNVARERPAAMVLVRNPTGVSHAPEEEVDLADAAAGASAILAVLEDLHR